jgi:hypothetical protein
VMNIFSSGNTFAWTLYSEAEITQCIFWVPRHVQAFLNLSLSNIIFLWFSTVQYSNMTHWRNLYNSPLVLLPWSYYLPLTRGLQTYLSCEAVLIITPIPLQTYL